MRRTKRTNETGIERVYNRWLKLQLFGLALFLVVVGGVLLYGWSTYNNLQERGKEQDAKWEQIIKQKEEDMQNKLDEFTESTNEDVQNTIDDIQGTEDTSGAEYYNEDPYTAPETQESVEQPGQETNGANNSTSETQESNQVEDNLPEPVPDESKQIDNNYLGPTKGELNGYDEWDKEDKEKYYSWDEQTRQAYEESIYREDE